MKRWQYLLFSTALAVIVLAVGTGSYLAIVRQERLEALEQTERDAEAYLEKLREARDQLREAEERLEALEDMLLNLHQMQQIAERSAAPSRGGRITLATMPLTTPSGFTAERLEMALAGTALAGLGQAFYGAEKAYGVNGVILAAICAHESGWGRSKLAREKGNLAGLGAYDGAEYSCGIAFDSRAASIMYLAQLLATHYAPGGKYFGGSFDLTGVGVRYASDPAWAAKVAGCVRGMVEVAHVIH
jgi:beta-N-acetylglucosaminidase